MRATATPLHLPFKQAFKHAAAERSESSSIWIELHDDAIVGQGEGCPRPYVTGETLASSLAAFEVAAAQLPSTFNALSDLDSWLAKLPSDQPSLRCAFECAGLELLSRRDALPMFDLFNCQSDRVTYSGVIGASDESSIKHTAKMCSEAGLADVKVKVTTDLDQNVKNLRLVRSVMGEAASIRVDANMAWSIQDADEHIEAVLAEGIEIIEQPLDRKARHDNLTLSSRYPGVIMLDESLVSEDDLDFYLRHGWSGRFLLKVSKQGGPLRTLKFANRAAEYGVPCHLGTHVGESSLLASAGRFVAAAFNFATVEGSAGTYLLARDVVENPMTFGAKGHGTVDRASLGMLGALATAANSEQP